MDAPGTRGPRLSSLVILQGRWCELPFRRWRRGPKRTCHLPGGWGGREIKDLNPGLPDGEGPVPSITARRCSNRGC